MTDSNRGKWQGGEQFLEPLDSGQVKVVGGLVEEQDVRFADQGLGNGQPFAPAAGEGGGLGLKAVEAGAAGERLQAAFAIALVGVGHGHGAFKHIANGEAGIEARVLGDISGA